MMDARKTQGKGSNRMQTYEGRVEGVKLVVPSTGNEKVQRASNRGVHDNILGHLIFSPSSHRMYNSSAMGDRLTGEASAALSAPGVVGVVAAPDGPAMSSTTSVTTSPRVVISLFRVTRLWGKSPFDVCTCCRMAALLTGRHTRVSE